MMNPNDRYTAAMNNYKAAEASGDPKQIEAARLALELAQKSLAHHLLHESLKGKTS